MKSYHSGHLSELQFGSVHNVPVEALHNAYSFEFNTHGRNVEQGFQERQADEPNPNDHPTVQAALEQSIATHGIKEPLAIQRDFDPSANRPADFIIRNGSHRLLAAQRLGLTEVPIRITNH
jgi:hypothetical protein